MNVHQTDAAQRRRLRWRARRGLLENDIVLERFFNRYESALTDRQVAGLDALLAETDNDLLDLILERRELSPGSSGTPAAEVLALLRRV